MNWATHSSRVDPSNKKIGSSQNPASMQTPSPERFDVWQCQIQFGNFIRTTLIGMSIAARGSFYSNILNWAALIKNIFQIHFSSR
jgi:hypothetical protein